MFNKLSAAPRTPLCPGLFVVGTDTGVGKTFVAARIAAELVEQGLKVGVYKPAASGCSRVESSLVSEDAVALWEAAGRPGTLEAVCPQRFAMPLAPHLAAKAEGRAIDSQLLNTGIDYWRERSGMVIVEGAGGLLSPLGERESVADLAADFGYPLVVVVPNRIGAINSCLLTLTAAKAQQKPLPVAAVVLNDLLPPEAGDPAVQSNLAELKVRCAPPIFRIGHAAKRFATSVNWRELAKHSPGPGLVPAEIRQ